MKLTLIKGNTLDELPRLESDSVDLAITSPPYWENDGFNKQYGGKIPMEKRDKLGHFLKGVRSSRATEFKKGQHWRPWRQFRDAEWLKNEYVIKQKSAKDIATENKCHENAIFFWLNKHGISRRTISEVRRIKYWGVTGEDNPMWNKKGELSSNWKGGITPERQAFYLSREWKIACRTVWRRDNAQCQRCGIKSEEGVPLHIHHLKSFADKTKRADIENLILLCVICHHWVHSRKNKEGGWIYAS